MEETTLLAKMERYAKAHGIAISELGHLATGNRALATRLRQGKTITVATMNKLLEYMRQPPANGHAP